MKGSDGNKPTTVNDEDNSISKFQLCLSFYLRQNKITKSLFYLIITFN
jgi:hypothetical protein